MNFSLIAAFAAIFFAQAIKFPIAHFSRKAPDIKIITSTGGMPSSHSAAVSSLITSLIFEYGFSSPYVAIATVFGVIIMFDSMGVRRQSGEQGMVIDAILQHLEQKEDLLDKKQIVEGSVESENPHVANEIIEDYEELVVTKYLGHKPSEVFAGIFTGGFVAIALRILYINLFVS